MQHPNKVVIFGGKGTAVLVAEQIYDAQHRFGCDIEVLGFAFDDEAYGPEINGFPVLCKTREAYEKFRTTSDVGFIFMLYRSDLIEERAHLRDSYGIPLDRYVTFIHPTAYIAKSAAIGSGCVICAHSVINTNARLGHYCTILPNVTVEHDTILGDSCFAADQACIGSNVTIGEGVFIGLNSTVRTWARVNEYSFIGMAATVINDVAARTTVVGNPARPINRK